MRIYFHNRLMLQIAYRCLQQQEKETMSHGVVYTNIFSNKSGCRSMSVVCLSPVCAKIRLQDAIARTESYTRCKNVVNRGHKK